MRPAALSIQTWVTSSRNGDGQCLVACLQHTPEVQILNPQGPWHEEPPDWTDVWVREIAIRSSDQEVSAWTPHRTVLVLSGARWLGIWGSECLAAWIAAGNSVVTVDDATQLLPHAVRGAYDDVQVLSSHFTDAMRAYSATYHQRSAWLRLYAQLSASQQAWVRTLLAGHFDPERPWESCATTASQLRKMLHHFGVWSVDQLITDGHNYLLQWLAHADDAATCDSGALSRPVCIEWSQTENSAVKKRGP
ncbi:MAG: hypothetical protein C7B46_16455 [Sulfobacillus benefaciens]|uniref:Uncharacterized protein n=1 Tax=Sulfobacillus benefaciens TaxID=453960 RepID=A0A2T2XBR3_9FIRM|nr:MAG: hypothetical protein C7B46_16455 [Sulfobacillus benefaciens]